LLLVHSLGRSFRITLLIAFWLSAGNAHAQNMDEGFSMLENGRFKKAKVFFGKVLKDYPANKTARLCYGRAVGLSGNPDEATGIFNGLLKDYQGDVEVRLNLAEAYLWKKDPEQAIPLYKDLLAADSTLFGAQLGISNSYSMASVYNEAYININKAIALDPTNEQAKVSSKYIRLGYANKLGSQDHDYETAFKLLRENLENNSKDEETLGLAANIYIISKEFAKADSVYQLIDQPLVSLKGQSISKHLLSEEEEALSIALQYREEARQTRDSLEILKGELHYITALLWNDRLMEARNKIDSIRSKTKVADPLISASAAEVAMYEGDFILGAREYDTLLSLEPKSFSGNLGKANARHAVGMDDESYNFSLYASGIFPGQSDIENFTTGLHHQHSPKVSFGYTYGSASDESRVNSLRVEGVTSLTPRWSLSSSYQDKDFTPTGDGPASESKSYYLGSSYQVNERLKANASAGLIQIDDNLTVNNRTDIDVSAEVLVSKVQKITFAFETEVQDFNAALINQNLRTNHLVIRNVMFWKNSKIGSYSELYRSYFSDGNRRNLLFTSLYKNVTKKPLIKTGINLLGIFFKENKPTLYYSPSAFYKLEGFTGIEYRAPKAKVVANFDLAGGYQLVDGDTQTNWRMQARASKEVGRFTFMASYMYTTIVETQIAGFSYSEVQAQLTYRITNTPLFWRKYRSKSQLNRQIK